MNRYAAIRNSKAGTGLVVTFWLLAALALVVGDLSHAHRLRALMVGTLCCICLGYSLYGARFANAKWRVRSMPHHGLWLVAAAGAAASVVWSIMQLWG